MWGDHARYGYDGSTKHFDQPGHRVCGPERGRGGRRHGARHQKAKQTKVARKLKYFSPDTDLDALQRELASGHDSSDEDDLYSRYADFADDEEQDDSSDDWDESYWTAPSTK